MECVEGFAEKEDRHQTAENRHEVNEKAGAVGPDQRHPAVEAEIGDDGGENGDVGYRPQGGEGEIIRNSKPELQTRFGVQRIGLFGSHARGEQRPESDIDILVSFSREIDLFDFVDLRDYLANRLHEKVDLVMDTALKPSIGKRILTEVEYV